LKVARRGKEGRAPFRPASDGSGKGVRFERGVTKGGKRETGVCQGGASSKGKRDGRYFSTKCSSGKGPNKTEEKDPYQGVKRYVKKKKPETLK